MLEPRRRASLLIAWATSALTASPLGASSEEIARAREYASSSTPAAAASVAGEQGTTPVVLWYGQDVTRDPRVMPPIASVNTWRTSPITPPGSGSPRNHQATTPAAAPAPSRSMVPRSMASRPHRIGHHSDVELAPDLVPLPPRDEPDGGHGLIARFGVQRAPHAAELRGDGYEHLVAIRGGDELSRPAAETTVDRHGQRRRFRHARDHVGDRRSGATHYLIVNNCVRPDRYATAGGGDPGGRRGS